MDINYTMDIYTGGNKGRDVMMLIEERYMHDPFIHNLVNHLVDQIESLQLTPTEVRECAMLASIKYEQKHAERNFYYKSEETDE
jgi:hypothetical protein